MYLNGIVMDCKLTIIQCKRQFYEIVIQCNTVIGNTNITFRRNENVD